LLYLSPLRNQYAYWQDEEEQEVAKELVISEAAITMMINEGVEDQRDRKERMIKCLLTGLTPFMLIGS